MGRSEPTIVSFVSPESNAKTLRRKDFSINHSARRGCHFTVSLRLCIFAFDSGSIRPVSPDKMCYPGLNSAEFCLEFASFLSEQDKQNLSRIEVFRNAVAHSNISLRRSYLLYRPNQRARKGDRRGKRTRKIVQTLGLEQRMDLASPRVLLVPFQDDNFFLEEMDVLAQLYSGLI